MTLITYGHLNSQIELREIDGGAFQVVRRLSEKDVVLLGTFTDDELAMLARIIDRAIVGIPDPAIIKNETT